MRVKLLVLVAFLSMCAGCGDPVADLKKTEWYMDQSDVVYGERRALERVPSRFREKRNAAVWLGLVSDAGAETVSLVEAKTLDQVYPPKTNQVTVLFTSGAAPDPMPKKGERWVLCARSNTKGEWTWVAGKRFDKEK